MTKKIKATTKKTKKEEILEEVVSPEARKKILAEESAKLEKVAQKAALKAMTEVQLLDQKELTADQKEAADLLGQGISYQEVAERLGKKKQEVVAWMALPSFVREKTERTLKHGSSDKTERVSIAKRIHDEMWRQMLNRIEAGDLDNMTFSQLEKFYLTYAQRIDTLIDKDESKNAPQSGLAVLILKHVQSSSGKQYDKLEDFLGDEEYKYPTIDVTPND
jgi:transcriptional regulator with XRE-family HTH domain